MELLWKGFPDTVDKLPPEIGSLTGPLPVMFFDCNFYDLATGSQDGAKFSQRSAEFGAEQVIIVRNTVAKKELQEQIS